MHIAKNRLKKAYETQNTLTKRDKKKSQSHFVVSSYKMNK